MIKLIGIAALSYLGMSEQLSEQLPLGDLVSPELLLATLISMMLLPFLRRIME